MIIDHIDNIMFYESLLPNLAAGMKAIEALESREVGRYEFEGGYFMIQQGVTKPLEEGTFEAHRKYIDVQIILDGAEELAWDKLENLTTVIPYNPEKDAERLDGAKDHVMLISKGMFYAAYPHDGHKPVSHTTEQHSFLKVVLKLPVQE